MRTALAAALSLAPALGLLAACSSAPAPLSDADRAAIQAFDSSFMVAANAGSVEGLTALYTDSATVMPPGMPASKGTEAIRQMWTGMMAQGRPSLRLTNTMIHGLGGLAYTTGTYHVEFAPADTAAPAPPPEDGKYLVVLRKQQDGSWKVVADIWNSDAPPPMPEAAPAPARRR